jgi:hypothetical protein
MANAQCRRRIDQNHLRLKLGSREQRSANLLTAEKFLERRPKEDRLSPGRLNRHRAMEFQGTGHAVDQQIATEVALVQALPDRDETQGFL